MWSKNGAEGEGGEGEMRERKGREGRRGEEGLNEQIHGYCNPMQNRLWYNC